MNFTINMFVVFALLGLAFGVVCFGVGMMAMADPEGRGGAYFVLLPMGAVLSLGCLGYCLHRLGAVFGWWA